MAVPGDEVGARGRKVFGAKHGGDLTSVVAAVVGDVEDDLPYRGTRFHAGEGLVGNDTRPVGLSGVALPSAMEFGPGGFEGGGRLKMAGFEVAFEAREPDLFGHEDVEQDLLAMGHKLPHGIEELVVRPDHEVEVLQTD